MLTSMVPPAAARLLSALGELAEVDMTALGGRELAALLRVLAEAEAKVCAVKLRVLGAAHRSGAARAAGAASTGQWAAKVTNSDQATSHRQAVLADGLAQRPATAAALAQGALSREHAEVIVRATEQLPATVTPAQRETVETALVEKARSLPPQALRKAARRAVAVVEADQAVVDAHENQLVAEEETAARVKTRLSLHDNGDGTVTGHFTLPILQGHLLRKVLEAMTAPRRGRLGATDAQVGAKRERTDWDHARGLAFCELLEHLPTDHLHPKTAATIVVKIDEDDLLGRLKAADLDTGGQVSAGEARRLACNAGILPAILAGRSQVLDLGRSKRLFSEPQRIALSLGHDTCAADGCERPFAWCELHHRQPWAHGGHTDLKDGLPRCHFHHQRIHDTDYRQQYLSDGSVTFTRRS